MPTCPACGRAGPRVFHDQSGAPVHSCLLLDDEAAARRFPRGRVRLALCPGCGFIANTAFDPAHSRYSSSYEETQGFSPRFRRFSDDLAARWVERYGLRGKRVVEIGCGKGEFLARLCELGDNRGLGIDPAYVPGRLGAGAERRITFVRELYTGSPGLDADAVVCRHTLEHIAPVGQFLRTIRRDLGHRPGAVVLFEVPDVLRVLEETAFWDVYYEHCSYFSLGSLARLFRACGFEVLDLTSAFDDQYLLVEARPSTVPAPGEPFPDEDDLERLGKAADHFAESFATRVERWRDDLRAAATQEPGPTVVWGSGSKGVAYLTTLGVADEVAAVVDINPHKQGRYMAGTGHRIVAPAALRDLRPGTVVVMNPAYGAEIRRSLHDLGLDPRVVTV